MGVARKRSVLSGIRGKVGTVVLSVMRGVDVVKEVPSPPKKDSQTAAQDIQRAKFKCANEFLLRIGYDVPGLGYQLRRQSGKTKINESMSDLMRNALKGTYPDFSIDFSKVQWSSPIEKIDACWKGSFVAVEEMGFELSWELNPFPGKMSRLHDQAVIVLFDETKGKNLYFGMHSREIVPRKALKWIYKGYPKLEGHHIHCWIFFVSADEKRVSDTEYLGRVTLKK